jgi:alpha-galactosidase
MELVRRGTVVDAPAPAALEVAVTPSAQGFSWQVANTGTTPVPVRSVAVVHDVGGVRGRLGMYQHGYQSWSRSGVVHPGVDTDPAASATLQLLVMSHHADERHGPPEVLRSELVTVLADDDGGYLAGFLGGDRHDGTFRHRPGPSGGQLVVEAFLGDAVLAPGEVRDLHDVVLAPTDDPVGALDAWAAECGRRSGARTGAPYQVGWCSWYHYFQHVTEQAFRENLARAADWPFEVFQLDDGFQSAVGDWTTTDETFPSGLAALAAEVAGAGLRPGLWIAPFVVAPTSRLAAEHPEWVARFPDGEPLIGMYNDHWGGFVHTLDTSHPEVLEHLESLAAELVAMGFTYLKLDFTYAPGFDGRYHDPSMTPAERVRAGYDAVRRGAGDDTFLLGCGAPLGACIGVVDGMRIGPDVAPWWAPQTELFPFPGYEATVPSTLNAWRNTLARAHQHRRLWLNDPDCLMLRTTDTDLTEDQVRAWALAVAASGGMAIVSDDLALLDDSSRALLEEVLALGRQVDDAARRGPAPRCEDLLSADPPTTLRSPVAELVGSPESGAATLERR